MSTEDVLRSAIQNAEPSLDMDGLLLQVEEHGMTVLAFEGTISHEERQWRRIRGPWFVPPALFKEHGFFPPARAGQWSDAAVAFFQAFFEAYGIGDFVIVEELDLLELKSGSVA